MNIKVVCLDFDMVVHDYKGWKGEGYALIEGEPLPGAKEGIKALRESGCLVLIHSTRCGYAGGAVAIMEYCVKHNLRVDGVCTNKPPADVYVDDKCVTHLGDWKQTVTNIQNFVPWNEKRDAEQASLDYHAAIGYTGLDAANGNGLDAAITLAGRELDAEIQAVEKDKKIGTGEI